MAQFCHVFPIVFVAITLLFLLDSFYLHERTAGPERAYERIVAAFGFLDAEKPNYTHTTTEKDGKRERLKRIKLMASEKYAARQQCVEDFCQKKRLKNNNKISWYLLEEEMLSVCRILKVSSTTWAHMLMDLQSETANLTTMERHEGQYIRKMFLYEMNATLQKQAEENTLTVAFVRHPIERLQSAYNEWFLKTGRDKSLRTWTIDFLNRTTAGQFNPRDTPTMEQFAQYILSQKKNLESGRPMDIYFRPQSRHCKFCKMHYDVIGHLETAKEDMKFVLDVLDMQDKVSKRTLNKRKSKDKGDNLNFRSSLFLETRREICELYKDDFLMFGYEFPGPYCK